jgi:hypothetical protein
MLTRNCFRLAAVPRLAGLSLLVALGFVMAVSPRLARGEEAHGEEGAVLPSVRERFAAESIEEQPSFQKHVVPLFGRLGCNARSCHGSFQGAGGFQLSLFGYDFQFDHDALTTAEGPPVDPEQPLESLILTKPTSAENHEGGQRFKLGNWEYHLLRRWIEGGAEFAPDQVAKLAQLEVTPREIVFNGAGEQIPLQAVAVWADGTREDVTPLCRFTANNDQIAGVDGDGNVTAGEPGDTHVVVSYDKAVVAVPVLRPISDRAGERYPPVATSAKIDELVVAKLRKLGIVPSEQADDAAFLRRVSLDLAGTLPASQEVEEFLASTSPNKRAEKINELLETPAYAAWWATKLCDFTGNNDVQLNNVSPLRKAGQEWYDWLERRVRDNMPYDELAAGIVLSQSRRPGQSYTEYCEEMSALYAKGSTASYADRPTMPHYWARNNFRQPEDRAIGFAYAFMGVRIQCAQCHKHPFDVWSKQDFEDFKGFFTRVTFNRNGMGKGTKEEMAEILKQLGVDPAKKGNQLDRELQKMVVEGKTIPFGELAPTPPRAANNKGKKKNDKGKRPAAPAQQAKVLGADEALDLNQFDDARQPLMAWLQSPENPYFARAFVNRVWANYFGVGIVEPPDDLSLGNPPSNQPLLDYLTAGFIEHKYDMKWLHREICNSDTYQRSWRTNDTNLHDERNFSRAMPRRLPAEVAYDAIQRATADDARATAMLHSMKDRAIAIATSNANANGTGKSGFALKVFGRSIRESNCDCDRSMEASLLQTVYLQNDGEVLGLLGPNGKGTWLAQLNAQWNPPAKKAEKRPTDGKQTRREIAKARVRLEAAKKLDDEEKVVRLERRLKQLQAELKKKNEEQPAVVAAAPEVPQPDATQLVREAYLRTLSRPPTAGERDRSLQFLAEASGPVQGMRDLMWALLNTKEFIVNH